MKKVFHFGLLFFVIYQFLNRYLVMPLPGSQELNSLFYSHLISFYKPYFEIILLTVIIYPTYRIFASGRFIIPSIAILFSVGCYYYLNNYFTAANRYREPKNLMLVKNEDSEVDSDIPIIGIEEKGIAKAYAVPFVRYHHKIIDEFADHKYLITYCGICRTGRVYKPYINDKYIKFRLVGVNRYNAVFEDEETKSWWSQETGVCIAGKLKGSKLTEVHSSNMSLNKWIELYPNTEIMQPDPVYFKRYRMNEDDYSGFLEQDTTVDNQTPWSRTDFIIGLSMDGTSKAVKWTDLLRLRFINDNICENNYILIVSNDDVSFTAFERPDKQPGVLKNDTLFFEDVPYNFNGVNLNNEKVRLKPVSAYREFWFSWKYANPKTSRFEL